ncbi:putative endonuclease (mitochondrion) [[Candida] anglica]|uniref:Cytochrome b n=1 Tax=[Candida] anglica TaxID=148631 RepID=A0ABP0EPW5_9ASCO
MTIRKTNPYLSLANSYLMDSPQPSSMNYWWNLGSLTGLCLVMQMLSGMFLAMHYSSHMELAFSSVEHMMRDVNAGWLMRYMHANGASFFFMCMYLHIGKALYYGSYKTPRTLAWTMGVMMLVLTMATAFMGYCLVYGQMSHWGATVMTNLLSAMPFLGNDMVPFMWGGFSVSNPTMQRFFALHYLLPFMLAALVVMHFMALHVHGSGNPVGMSGNMDRMPMHSYFMFKDLMTVFVFMFMFSLFMYFSPNTLGHADNYMPGNAMVTPASMKQKMLTDKNSSKEEITKELQSNNSIKMDNFNKDFRLIMNGLFQAEGHMGGELFKPNTMDFKPMVYMSLYASDKTMKLFKHLNNEFNNKLNYKIYLNKSGMYYMRMYTMKWDIIMNKWMPYFNNCYGDKQRDLKMLMKLYYLSCDHRLGMNSNNNNFKMKFMYLVYNMVDNSQKFLSLNEKINLVMENAVMDLNYLKTYFNNIIKLNMPKMSMPFMLGLYLGDGSFDMFIRHKDKSVWYNPCLMMNQKYTKDNDNLLKLMSLFLNDLNITSNMSYRPSDSSAVSPTCRSGNPKNNTMMLLKIESMKNMKLLESEFKLYNQYFFNKSEQMYLLEKACTLLNKVKFWRESNTMTLSLMHNNKNIKNYNFYMKMVNDYFDKVQNDNYFISLNDNKSWNVKLPMKIKPNKKYFTFMNSKSEIIMDKLEALNLAKNYRNEKLKNWLIENKLM